MKIRHIRNYLVSIIKITNYIYSPGLRLERYYYKHDTFTLRDGTALTNNLSVLSLLI